MTRTEALDRATPPQPRLFQTVYATGTDGERWFLARRAANGDEATYELVRAPSDLCRDGWYVHHAELAGLEVEGCDWASGWLELDEETLRWE